MIYFLKCLDRVKIGHTTRLSVNRIAELQIGNPEELSLLGEMDGSRKEEQALHARFQKCWVRGEWFDLTDELAEFLDEKFGPKPFELMEAYLLTHPEVATNLAEGMFREAIAAWVKRKGVS